MTDMTPDDVLETIFDEMPETDDTWGYNFYPVRGNWAGPAELYFTDHNGVCWQITAKEHPHA